MVNRPPWDGLNIEPRFGNNFIDANVLDRGTTQHDAAVERILGLVNAGEFTLLLPHSVKSEIEHPNTPMEVKRRAAGLIYSMPVELTAPELATHKRIRTLIQGNAKSGKHDSDAFHLVEAHKYGGRHFITNDTRLLSMASQIWTELQLRVLTPQEFIDEYYPHDSSAQDENGNDPEPTDRHA